MTSLEPINQVKLYGLGNYFKELVELYRKDIYPNKLLISGQKGIGKSTLAYHFINYVLTLNEDFQYDYDNFEINANSKQFKTILNKSNTNLTTVDVTVEKKKIDINQIRELIINLNKSSFNNKCRFVLIDNIELLNINSINALLKILEEPNKNVYFILINNNKKIHSTLLSRCINYKISLSNEECLNITNQLINDNLENLINKDLINYYFTPGEIYNLLKFASQNNCDLSNINLKDFLKFLIEEGHYKKNVFMNKMIPNLIEFYLRKLNSSFSKIINEKYSYFIKRISDTKTYNLDQESLFMEFNDEILNG